MNKRVLDINDLNVGFSSYGETTKIVTDVSFHIDEGETVGIVGESGCGKSMTALSVMRLIKCPPGYIKGEIRLNGKNLLELSERQMCDVRGKDVSMIFQEPMTSLNPVITIGKQLMEVFRSHEKMTREEAWKKSVEALELVKIASPEQRMKEYPHQLSGGMRQRVMIAMSLSCNPKILIADEPTTALDVTIQAQILKLMNELKHKYDTSIILITHNLGVVAQICDRVAVMYFGRIMETAPVKRLFEQPLHPYTKGLFLCIPKLDQDEDFLSTIPGMVPALTEKTQGCAFAPRCPRCTDRCRREEPELVEVEEGHFCRCWGVLEDKA